VLYKGREIARIITRRELWGKRTYELYSESTRSLVTAAEEQMSPPSALTTGADRVVFVATAARLAEAMSQGALLSPFHGSLIPLPHQIKCLQRALSTDMVRFLLADEVGLGKTIEAGLIMRELKLRGLVKRVLIVAPKGLTGQWQAEMRDRFGEAFSLILPGAFSALRHAAGSMNIWKSADQVICPLDTVKPLDSRKGWSDEQVAAHNRERFEDLVTAGWDLVIADEAHRIGGSTSEVARYKLGHALSDAAPYLLLLSATPHQGKTDSFWRLVSLLDRQAFPDAQSVSRRRVAPYVIRTEKRQAIDVDGKPLFKKRTTQMVKVKWATDAHAELYRQVTEYVRKGYNLALREKRNYIGFLMVLMQRLVTSSTAAIVTALEKRLAVLEADPSEQAFIAPNWWELEGDDMMTLIERHQEQAMQDEKAQVESLLTLARRALQTSSDGKAMALLDIIRTLEAVENDPNLKALVFTEYIPTQEMLREFFSTRGYTVVTLNGSMDIDERKRVQEDFRTKARLMISTDAGGEGLNLQFCHVVANYDLPWNPMKIEQRIGRVDRIGQACDVRAYNLIVDEAIERRLREVLEEKLEAILAEFGIDKASDVLDSGEAIADFDRLFVELIIDPNKAQHKLDELLHQFRLQAMQAAQTRQELYDTEPLTPALAQQVAESPIPFWVEQMTSSYLSSEGVKIKVVEPKTYEVVWPGETQAERLSFRTDNTHDQLTTLEHPRIRELMDKLHPWLPGAPLPLLDINSLGFGLSGTWSLWRVSLSAGEIRMTRIVPLFLHDDGRNLRSSAQRIWDHLSGGGQITCHDSGTALSNEMFGTLDTLAQQSAEEVYSEMVAAHMERISREQRKMEYAFSRREESINRHGLSQVRSYRLRELHKEQEAWLRSLGERHNPMPALDPIIICKVVTR